MCVEVIASQMWDVFETRCTGVHYRLEIYTYKYDITPDREVPKNN